MAFDRRELDELMHHGIRYAYSLTHDQTEAEDLLQDAWLNLIRYDGPRDRLYFIKVIRNRFLERLRKRQPNFTPLHLANEGDFETESDVEFPEALDWSGLHGALAELRPEEREAVYLNVVEEYTAAEIADITGRSRGTVLSLLFRTKKKLRAMLSAQEAS
ncbi:MAG: RNA polymerase sigma factor [Deltaproteobacteria bacterium]|nr:RNA polymerase sigma factor [Deltaproteobacteria bacterium]